MREITVERYQIDKDGHTYEVFINTKDDEVTSKIMSLQKRDTKCATFGRCKITVE